MENTEEKSILHFTRIRSKDEPSFYDPQTDIRKLFPATVKTTLFSLEDRYAKNEKLKNDFIYIYRCFCIFQLQIAENPTPCADQVQAFVEALNKVDRYSLFLWFQSMIVILTCIYGLFARRDVKTDGSVVNDILETGRFSLFMSMLSNETKDAIHRDLLKGLPAGSTFYPNKETIDPNGFIVCDETGDIINNIKSLASLFISHTGNNSWNALAAACDDAFNANKGDTKEQKVCLAMAYPTYDNMCLSVEVDDTNDDSTR